MSIDKFNEYITRVETGNPPPNGSLADVIDAKVMGYDAYCDTKREQRNTLLAETDWWAVQDRTMTQAEKDYRQALRDVPAQEGFPTDIVWPTKP